MLHLRCALLLAVISSVASLYAEPVAPPVERAKYVLHLKVAGLEEPAEPLSKDGDKLVYGPEYAVCDVEDILLGMVATDKWGRVRVACVSRKNTEHEATEIRHEVGDEFTIVADLCELNARKGMIFPQSTTRIDGKPARDLRDAIYDRAQRAEKLAKALDALNPGALEAANAALDEFDSQAREDFKDLSPEADLLLDFAAMARYTPDVADLDRPALDQATRSRHIRQLLETLCDFPAADADAAAALCEGAGHGLGLLRPGKADTKKAHESLRKLAEHESFHKFAALLLGFDAEQRALAWFAAMAMDSGPSAEAAQWALIEAVEGGYVEFSAADKLLAPERSASLPYDDAGQRAIACAIDKRATRLAAWLVMRRGSELKASSKVSATAGVVDAHAKKAVEYYGSLEMLQVYAFALATQGEEAKHVADARAQMAKKRSDKLDLTDLGAIESELRKKGMPDAVRRVTRNGRTQPR